MRARRRLSRPWLPAPGFADLRLLSGNGHAVATGTLADLAPVPERTKGTACKAVKPRVQIPPGAPGLSTCSILGSTHCLSIGPFASSWRTVAKKLGVPPRNLGEYLTDAPIRQGQSIF